MLNIIHLMYNMNTTPERGVDFNLIVKGDEGSYKNNWKGIASKSF